MYLHGLHDPGGEHLMASHPGWLVITEEIGTDPANRQGVDYQEFSRRGFVPIVRLNNGYAPNGTIPDESKYEDFATRCANFCRAMRGATTVIIGNEPNHIQERPNGVAITPTQMAKAFNLCYQAIKNLAPQVQVLVPAVAPWNHSSGDWLAYWSDMLMAIQKCDGIAIHAYTHGSDRALVVSDESKEGRYWHFRVYRDFINAIPPQHRGLPIHITETNQGDDAWANENKGWVLAAYSEINAWNSGAGNPKIHSLSLYRWLNYDRWGLIEKDKVHDDFRNAVAQGFALNSAPVPPPDSGGNPPEAFPREIDPNAWRKETRIVVPELAPGTTYWRVTKLLTPDEAGSDRYGPDHHALVNVIVDGKRVVRARLLATWPGGQAPFFTKRNDAFAYSGDFPLSPGEFSITVDTDGLPSETVQGVRMGWWDSSGNWNPGAHTSTLIEFTRAIALNTDRPTGGTDAIGNAQKFPEPRLGVVAITELNIRSGPGTDYAIVGKLHLGDGIKAVATVERQGFNWLLLDGEKQWVAGQYVSWGSTVPSPPDIGDERWANSWPIVLQMEGGLSLDPNDPGNWYQGRLIGTKYGISAAVWGGQYDIPNLTQEQALRIYYDHYWLKAGCNTMAWPMCLVVFDTAVNHGVNTALAILNEQPTPEDAYLGRRALRYFNDANWRIYGVAWGNRVRHIREAGKAIS